MTETLTEEWYEQALSRAGVMIVESQAMLRVNKAGGDRFYGEYPSGTTFAAIFTAVTRSDDLYDAGVTDGRRQAFAELRDLIGASSTDNL